MYIIVLFIDYTNIWLDNQYYHINREYTNYSIGAHVAKFAYFKLNWAHSAAQCSCGSIHLVNLKPDMLGGGAGCKTPR